MSRNSHVILERKNINGAIKNLLLKNSFPKKEKKNYKSFQRARERTPGPGEAINAFSKIFIYEYHLHTIYASSYLRALPADHLCTIFFLNRT